MKLVLRNIFRASLPKTKSFFFVFCFLFFIYLNFFYNLLLISKGLEYSARFQYFLCFLFIACLLISPFLLAPGISFRISHLIFFLSTVIFFPASISSMPIGENFLYVTTTTFLPLFIFFLIYNILRNGTQVVAKYIIIMFIYYFLFRALLYLLLIPFEISFSGKIGVHNLQFSGGQYHNIAILILILLLIEYLEKIGICLNFEKRIAWILYISTTVLSFSRVGIILLFLYVIIQNLFLNQSKLKSIFYYCLFFLFILLSLQFISTEYEDNLVFQYWMNRLNIDFKNSSTIFSENSIFSSDSNDNLRLSLLQIGQQRNLISYIFGIGIGATPYFLGDITNGEIVFGSFHNFFGTIFFERGIFIFFLVFLFFIYILYKILQVNGAKGGLILKYMMFIIFISTTGAELFVNSRDFNIDMILCLLLVDLVLFKKVSNLLSKNASFS